MKSYRLYSISGQRDQFIDWLKGIAIIGVVWLHCMPLQDEMLSPLWCGMSVSFFLLIQVFHGYRRGAQVRFPDVTKLWKRIISPMLIVTAILGIINWRYGIVRHAGGIVHTLVGGGFGPGSYYPWLYLQFAVMIPLLGRLQRWLKPVAWGGLILAFSIIIDSMSAFVEMPEWLWRIMFFRYVLLIWLGYDVITHGIRLTRKLLVLSAISIIFILVTYYKDPDFSPWLIHNGWKVEHWPAYFYPAYLLLWLLRVIYDKTSEGLHRIIACIGNASYEIFLLQMSFFALLDAKRVNLFTSDKLNLLLFLACAWAFNVLGGLVWKNGIIKTISLVCERMHIK